MKKKSTAEKNEVVAKIRSFPYCGFSSKITRNILANIIVHLLDVITSHLCKWQYLLYRHTCLKMKGNVDYNCPK